MSEKLELFTTTTKAESFIIKVFRNQPRCDICRKCEEDLESPLLEFKGFSIAIENNIKGWIESPESGYVLICLDCIVEELMAKFPNDWQFHLFRSIGKITSEQ